MKYLTIYHEGNKIEIYNSILGQETIIVNNEVVSSKYSIFGTEHTFKIKDDSSDYRIGVGMGITGVTYSFYKDGIAIIEPSNSAFGQILFIGFCIVIIIAFAVTLWRGFQELIEILKTLL